MIQNQNVSLMKAFKCQILKRKQNLFISMQIALTQSKSAKQTRIASKLWQLTVQRKNIEVVPWHFVMITAVRKIGVKVYVASVEFVQKIITLTFAVNVLMTLSKPSDAFGFCHFSSLYQYSLFYFAYSTLFFRPSLVYAQRLVIKKIRVTHFSEFGTHFHFIDRPNNQLIKK